MLTLQYSWLLALLILPWILPRLLPPHRAPRSSLRVPFMDRLEAATGSRAAPGSAVPARSPFQRVLLLMVWSLLVLALARPQWIGEATTKTIPSRDVLLAIDLSASMEQEDFVGPNGDTIDRLEAVKFVLDEFLSRREGDRVGLILFGSAAFVQTPFTEDIEACRTLLNEAEIGMAGPQTVIGDAIGLAITVFEKSDIDQRMLILLTDGNDSGSKVPPENAARIAADYDITIHTIAVGAAETAGRDAIDEEALRSMAKMTGGGSFRAASRDELANVYARIDGMKAHDAEVVTHRPTTDLFHWPLGLGLALTFAGHGALVWRHRR